MRVKAPKVGNSTVLRINKTMKEYLGVADADPVELEVDFRDGEMIVRKPRKLTFEEAVVHTQKQFDNALRNLAK